MTFIPEDILDRRMNLTPDARTILESRYLRKDKDGNIIETPEEMCLRIATEAARAGQAYDKCARSLDERKRAFYWLLVEALFSPNSPTWMNAGTDNPQNAACFVLPVRDSLPEIFDAVKAAALIHQSGGGTGFDFSGLRPQGDVVRSTGGVASGPVSFMSVFNAATETIKQGGKRRGANIGILRVDHPDIEKFITCKEDNSSLSNFNISVGITDAFMEAVEADTGFPLVNPRTGQVHSMKRARHLFDLIVDHAWRNGEPGIVFLDRIEEGNPTPALGRITATNPCGEQPLLPYEACNLGSVNLQRMFASAPISLDEALEFIGPGLPAGFADACAEIISDDITRINWPLLRTVVHESVDFLDSIIDVSEYPLPAIDEMVRRTRKIGLGIMGLADLFILLGIPYTSEKAEALAELIARFITSEARQMSRKLAFERGPFPAFGGSVFERRGEAPVRNATVTTIAPTGTISMVANASSGCEPLFGIAFTKQNVLGGKNLTQTNPMFEADLRARGIYSEELMLEVAKNGGSVQGVPGVPPDMAELYRTALEISWEWHVRIQAAIQRGVDNAVSKTINMPNEASREEVGHAYVLAHRAGCKGLTVYRSGSREHEVISLKPKARAEDDSGRKPYTVGQALWGKLKPIDRPETLSGITRRVATPSGTLWATLNLYEDKPFELFCQIGRAGTDVYAFTEAIARLMSLALRAGVDPEEISRQLRGIGGSGQVGFGPNRVLSVPDAIGRMLDQARQTRYAGAAWYSPSAPGPAPEDTGDPAVRCDDYEQKSFAFPNGDMSGEGPADKASGAGDRQGKVVTRHDLCPSCGNYSLTYASGCSECRLCGYSAC